MKKQMTRMAALVMTACLFTGCAGQSGQPAGDGGSGTNGTSQAQESRTADRKERIYGCVCCRTRPYQLPEIIR